MADTRFEKLCGIHLMVYDVWANEEDHYGRSTCSRKEGSENKKAQSGGQEGSAASTPAFKGEIKYLQSAFTLEVTAFGVVVRIEQVLIHRPSAFFQPSHSPANANISPSFTSKQYGCFDVPFLFHS